MIKKILIVFSCIIFSTINVKDVRSQELAIAGSFIALGVTSVYYDESIASYFQNNNIQGLNYTGQYFLEPLTGGYAGLPVLALSWYYGNKKDRQDITSFAINGAKAFVFARAITYIPKYFLHRERPFEQEVFNNNIWHGPSFSSENTSFPGGHSASAFALAVVAHKEFSDYKWVAPFAYSVATISSFSRVYRNQHWMSDVVAGAIIGLLSGYAINEVSETFIISPSYSKESASIALYITF